MTCDGVRAIEMLWVTGHQSRGTQEGLVTWEAQGGEQAKRWYVPSWEQAPSPAQRPKIRKRGVTRKAAVVGRIKTWS